MIILVILFLCIMWTLILTISLKSQFNHALDVKFVQNINTEQQCLDLGSKTTDDLKYFDKDVHTKIRCEKL